MNTKDIRQGRKLDTWQVIVELHRIAKTGTTGTGTERETIRRAAVLLEELAKFKLEHLPAHTERDYKALLEECTWRGGRIRELEKQLARARHEGPEIGKAATVYCYDEKTASGLIEED
jgi:hypothetical protein